jgi:hypothetical protein
MGSCANLQSRRGKTTVADEDKSRWDASRTVQILLSVGIDTHFGVSMPGGAWHFQNDAHTQLRESLL